MLRFKPMDTAPKPNIKIYGVVHGKLYPMEYRYGMRGEPNQDLIEWRVDCCGRFATPIAWLFREEIKVPMRFDDVL